MENKINIAELLKDCPSGMELDSPMYDNLYFDCVEMEEEITYPIKCYIQKGVMTPIRFNKFGQFTNDSKCVIFPKGKTTWEGFRISFKDGDIVSTEDGAWIGITQGGKNKRFIPTYCVLKGNGEFEAYFDEKENWCFYKLATEEEKQKLFDAIKANGYKWNAETKTLEKLNKPKFKVEDIESTRNSLNLLGNVLWLAASVVKKKDKFDIATLKPFDKVLVRVCDGCRWYGDFYMWYDCTKKNFPYHCACGDWSQCIPYEANKELLGKTDDCDEFYKTWE